MLEYLPSEIPGQQGHADGKGEVQTLCLADEFAHLGHGRGQLCIRGSHAPLEVVEHPSKPSE